MRYKNKIIHSLILLTFITSYILSFFTCFNVSAMSASEIKNRDACNTLQYELAYANYDGTLSTKSCYETYEEAKNIMNESVEENSDNLVILERKNSITQIIDAKYALIDYDQIYGKTTNLYDSLESKSAFTYITGGQSDDAAFIDFDYNTKRIKIMISGYIGWMDKYNSNGENQYDIVPISWVKSSAYYKVTESAISHYLPENLYATRGESSYSFGPKPTQLEVGNYYSYDGKYFYKDLKTMLSDYKNGIYENSVNKNDPYYNYYQYLPHRTKSNYTSEDIDNYITKLLGYTSKATAYPAASKESMLFDEGKSFYSAESLYGVNSLLIFGVARNESGNGRSRISIEKNNMFGHNAVDSDPYASGSSYLSVGYGIYAHAYKWLSYGYLQPGDYRFMGGHLGNKSDGLNIKYASDPYWGEKAAANYYQFDKYYDFQDYNYYSIAVKTSSTTVYATKTPKVNDYVNKTYYKLTLMDTPIIIVEETTGETVEGNNKWYKIMSDPTLDENLNYIGSSTSDPRVEYNWSTNYVYVPAAYFTKINNAEYKNPADIVKSEEVVLPETPEKDEENNNNNENDNNNNNENNNDNKDDNNNENDSNSKDEEEKEEEKQPEVEENLPSTDNPSKNLEYKDGYLYHYETFNYNEKTKLMDISGFLAITGMNNKASDNISHRLIFKNVDSEIEYIYNLERWINNVPFEMINSDEKTKYDYSGGWFKASLDISNLPQGDYRVYIEVSNGNYKTRTNFNNLLNKTMVRKMTTENKKGFNFQMNYYEKSVPLEVSVRNQGLISTLNPPTNDTMYNSFTKLSFNNNNLVIKGTSHNVGVDYSKDVNVERTLILENISTYERHSYNIGSITNGDYQVTLKASDGKDKTKAWFECNVDISKLPKGIYAIYIKTKGNGGEDYGELNDLLYTTINQKTTINNNKISLRRVDSKRFRIELVIE